MEECNVRLLTPNRSSCKHSNIFRNWHSKTVPCISFSSHFKSGWIYFLMNCHRHRHVCRLMKKPTYDPIRFPSTEWSVGGLQVAYLRAMIQSDESNNPSVRLWNVDWCPNPIRTVLWSQRNRKSENKIAKKFIKHSSIFGNLSAAVPSIIVSSDFVSG
jgi:hypothetical protein